jgi:hypothetical protein
VSPFCTVYDLHPVVAAAADPPAAPAAPLAASAAALPAWTELEPAPGAVPAAGTTGAAELVVTAPADEAADVVLPMGTTATPSPAALAGDAVCADAGEMQGMLGTNPVEGTIVLPAGMNTSRFTLSFSQRIVGFDWLRTENSRPNFFAIS